MNIKGTVTRIFAEKDSGFKIVAVSILDLRTIPLDKRNPDYPDSISAVGVLKGVERDYVVELSGEWENRPSGSYWPWQLKVSDYSICELETPKLLYKFLCELPNVNDELAKRIMCYFQDPQAVIENHPQRLTELKGIDKDKARQIHDAFLEQVEKKSLDVFLSKYGIHHDEIKKISSFYGTGALKLIKANPYRLCDDRFLSFRLCDRIGKDLGWPPDSDYRLRTAMNHVLYVKAAAKGHVYLTEDILVEETNAFFNENAVIVGSFSKESLETKLHNLSSNNEIIYDKGKYYHPDRYDNEKDVAEILIRRTEKESPYADWDEALIGSCIALVQENIGIVLDELQKQAVITAMQNLTSIITGGPGSGKTTLLSVFIQTFELLCRLTDKPAPVISLAAPTGMASKRMASSSGREAKTIHKLFEIKYDTTKNREEPNSVLSDVVVLDEVSMLDIDIMACILRSMKDDTILILIGDVDQIPSIGPGNVLADMIDSETLPVTRLTRSYRHGHRKTILANAVKINTGEEDLITNRSDFVFFPVPDRASDKECVRLRCILERVYCEEFLAVGKDQYKIQVISPLRSKTQASVDELNAALQRIANPEMSETEQIHFGKVVFRKGDKVMQVSNNYEKGVFNGDVGVIQLVSVKKKRILVNFQGVEADYSEPEFEQLKHAFATTVHKAQGSEYPIVIMAMTNFHSMLLLRNLFYTGVTRAKQRLILVGDPEAIRYAIRNTKSAKRLSHLCFRLKEEQTLRAA